MDPPVGVERLSITGPSGGVCGESHECQNVPMPHDPRAAAAIERLVDADDAFVALEGPIEAGRPWPDVPVTSDDPESGWGPPEVLAHVAEMLGYWLGQMDVVIAGAPGPVPMGRATTDPQRARAIEDGRRLSTSELLGQIRVGIGAYVARLPLLSAGDWDARGVHPRLGEMTVAAMLDRFILSHVDEHVVQIEATLERARSRG